MKMLQKKSVLERDIIMILKELLPEFMKWLREECKAGGSHIGTFLKWLLFSVVSGIVVGLIGTLFFYCMKFVTDLRVAHPAVMLTLPFGGLCIIGMYHLLHDEKDSGTNLVLSAIHSGEEIPLRMAPLIFLSTLITHLGGGSAGREGAALQLGGSIGNSLGRLFRFDEKDQHIMIMCGMSAAFSALFGTPMAAAIFPMEIVSVGIMHYAALVPCVISSFIAHGIAEYFGATAHTFFFDRIPSFNVPHAVIISLLAMLCAFISVVFCMMLHNFERLYRYVFKNPYLRAFAGGCFVLLVTACIGNYNYNGTGMDIIASSIHGSTDTWAFFFKMVLTAFTLGAGFKGGEIVPSFFVGATFGCLFGNLTGFAPSLCAAVGMSAVFCGVTNAPISSLLISFELFGYDGMPYYLLAIALSYMLSGYYGLYRSQKIVYSKFKTSYINRKTH